MGKQKAARKVKKARGNERQTSSLEREGKGGGSVVVEEKSQLLFKI